MTEYTIHKFNEYEFICHTWSTSRAWGHEVHLIDGTSEISQARVRYLNRTWEKYTYQSAMYEAVLNLIKKGVARAADNYKWNHGSDAKLPKGFKAQKEAELKAYYQPLLDYIEKGEE